MSAEAEALALVGEDLAAAQAEIKRLQRVVRGLLRHEIHTAARAAEAEAGGYGGGPLRDIISVVGDIACGTPREAHDLVPPGVHATATWLAEQWLHGLHGGFGDDRSLENMLDGVKRAVERAMGVVHTQPRRSDVLQLDDDTADRMGIWLASHGEEGGNF